MRVKAGYTTNALRDVSTGTHAFGRDRHELMFQALNLLSTHSMGHRVFLIWLGISKMNVQLYTINKQPFSKAFDVC